MNWLGLEKGQKSFPPVGLDVYMLPVVCAEAVMDVIGSRRSGSSFCMTYLITAPSPD